MISPEKTKIVNNSEFGIKTNLFTPKLTLLKQIANSVPIPFIKHAISVEHTEIERAVSLRIHSTHKQPLGLPKLPLKKWNPFLILKFPIVTLNPDLFQTASV